MKTSKKSQQGMSLIEIVIVMAIVSVLMITVGSFFTRTMNFYKRVRVRQQLVLQSRSSMDLIVQMLKYGKAKSVIISTPIVTPLVPNSQIDFNLQDTLPNGTTAYTFYLSSGIVFATEYHLNGTNTTKSLANYVTSLMFTGDSRDPAIVNVAIRMDIPWDNSGKADHVTSIIMPTQVVQMKMSP
jgi:prepilin-type N-terminal cleavage/methylation domain-containing protein